jgi:hypothetical protein
MLLSGQYMYMLAYAPLGALAWMQFGFQGDQSMQLLYGLAAGAGAGWLLMRQGMGISAMYLYPASGASIGYLFLGQYVGGQFVGAIVGAALGYGLYMMQSGRMNGGRSGGNVSSYSGSIPDLPPL